MNEGKEDPILPAPESGKDASTIVAPTPDAHQDDPVSNPVESTGDEKEKAGLNYDERRLSLLNDPNYGVILCFLDKFRAHVDIQDYPLHLLEENLLSDEENSKIDAACLAHFYWHFTLVSRRLIDFHLTLLKRISLGKGAKRDKFVSIISKVSTIGFVRRGSTSILLVCQSFWLYGRGISTNQWLFPSTRRHQITHSEGQCQKTIDR